MHFTAAAMYNLLTWDGICRKGSLTNSAKDITAFCKLISAAISCHANTTELSWERLILLIWNLANQNYIRWGKFTMQSATVPKTITKWEGIGSQSYFFLSFEDKIVKIKYYLADGTANLYYCYLCAYAIPFSVTLNWLRFREVFL